MPWSGSTFSRDTGVYSGSTAWAQTESGGRGIRSDDHDAHDQDIADGITACLKKDGGNSPSANIDWGGFKITNLANGTSSGDAVNKGQLDALSSVSLSDNNTWTGTNVFQGATTVGDTSGDTVVIKGTTVNANVSAMWDASSAAAYGREVMNAVDTATAGDLPFWINSGSIIWTDLPSIMLSNTAFGNAKGRIIYHNGSTWTFLAPP